MNEMDIIFYLNYIYIRVIIRIPFQNNRKNKFAISYVLCVVKNAEKHKNKLGVQKFEMPYGGLYRYIYIMTCETCKCLSWLHLK